jgi:catechol 2,3-dioxygenase-like lactoylglutathione lyase family enzyme
MQLKLSTIIIFVQNVEKLKTFYVDSLKLSIVEEIRSEWLLLQAGNCKIGLHKIGDQYLDKNKGEFKFDNNTKIVFEPDEDIYKIRERLLNQNVSIKEVTTYENFDFLFCDGEDPEGNVFRLQQRKK